MKLKEFLQGKALGHPSHPFFVHFPSALFPASLLLDLLSWWADAPGLARAAVYDLALGCGFGLLAVLTGFLDYLGMIPGSRKHRVATWHWVIQVAVMGTFTLSLGVRAALSVPFPTPVWLLALSAFGVLGLLVGSYFGGELVYRMGMRVSTGPQPPPPLLVPFKVLWRSLRGMGERQQPARR